MYANSPEDTSRNVTTTANGDHKVRMEILEDGISRLLAQLVHLEFVVSIRIGLYFSSNLYISSMIVMQTARSFEAHRLMHEDNHKVVHTWL